MKLCFLVLLLPMISCSSVKVRKPVPVVKEHWVKVSDYPPTYCPKGYDPKAERNFRTGNWIEIGDVEGSRFFIPDKVSGTESVHALFKEAMGARSEMMQEKINKQVGASNAQDGAVSLMAAPLRFTGYGLPAFFRWAFPNPKTPN